MNNQVMTKNDYLKALYKENAKLETDLTSNEAICKIADEIGKAMDKEIKEETYETIMYKAISQKQKIALELSQKMIEINKETIKRLENL